MVLRRAVLPARDCLSLDSVHSASWKPSRSVVNTNSILTAGETRYVGPNGTEQGGSEERTTRRESSASKPENAADIHAASMRHLAREVEHLSCLAATVLAVPPVQTRHIVVSDASGVKRD